MILLCIGYCIGNNIAILYCIVLPRYVLRIAVFASALALALFNWHCVGECCSALTNMTVFRLDVSQSKLVCAIA